MEGSTHLENHISQNNSWKSVAAVMSHEIGNPLMTVIGLTEILHKQQRPRSEYWDILTDELDRLKFIVSQFQRLSIFLDSSAVQTNIFTIIASTLSSLEEVGPTISVKNNVQYPVVYTNSEAIQQALIRIIKSIPRFLTDVDSIILHIHNDLRPCTLSIKINFRAPEFYCRQLKSSIEILISRILIESYGGTIDFTYPAGGGVIRISLPTRAPLQI